MLEGFSSYWEQCISDSLLVRVFILVFSLLFVLEPPFQKKAKPTLLFILKGLGASLFFLLVGATLQGIVLAWSPANISFFLVMLSEMITLGLTCFLYAALFSKLPMVTRFLLTCFYFIGATSCLYLSHVFGHAMEVNVGYWTTWPLLFLIYGLIVLFAFFIRVHSLRRVLFVTRGSRLTAWLSFGVILFLTLLTLYLDTVVGLNSYYSSIIFFADFFFSFFAYDAVYVISVERYESYRQSMENQLIRASNEQIELTEQNMSDLRKIRHDMKNQFAYMNSLYMEKQYDKLGAVLSQFSSSSLKPEFYVDCGNKDVSAILTMESSKAHAKNIKLVCTLVVPPVLPFDGRDLCSILANLIDNAIESDLRYGLTDDIRILINLREEYLHISVSNRLPEDANAGKLMKLESSKEKPEEHGLGTQIVLRLAEKYDGFTAVDVHNNTFIAEVLLDMMSGGAKRS